MLSGLLPLGATPDGLAQGSSRTAEPISPIEVPSGLDPRKVELGRRLFHDPILSRDGSIACASCHDLTRGGADDRAHSLGVGNAEGPVNAPTVYNSARNIRQFWDGRAPSLEAQVDGPVTNPLEMAAPWPDVLARLESSPYGEEFRAIYGGPPSVAWVSDAIAIFEQSLATVNSRFDRWLRGEDTAISAEERQGYELFKSYGCVACHQGANVGGNMFQRFGYFGTPLAGMTDKAGQGRFAVTGRPEDLHVFKVPSLRMATLTAPYFHDGSVNDLGEAIRLMGRYQLGREIPPADVDLIIKFLGALVGTASPATAGAP